MRGGGGVDSPNFVGCLPHCCHGKAVERGWFQSQLLVHEPEAINVVMHRSGDENVWAR